MGTSWALGIGTKGVYRVTRVYHQWQRDAAGALEGHSGFHRGMAGVLGLSQGWWRGGGGYSSGTRGTLGLLKANSGEFTRYFRWSKGNREARGGYAAVYAADTRRVLGGVRGRYSAEYSAGFSAGCWRGAEV